MSLLFYKSSALSAFDCFKKWVPADSTPLKVTFTDADILATYPEYTPNMSVRQFIYCTDALTDQLISFKPIISSPRDFSLDFTSQELTKIGLT